MSRGKNRNLFAEKLIKLRKEGNAPPAQRQTQSEPIDNNHSNHWISGLQSRNPNTMAREIETRVVGVTFENRQSVIRRMTVGDRVWLRREPTNAYDPNAIRVETYDGAQIGYISRIEAAALARVLDEHGKAVPGVVTFITGSHYYDSNLGVRIRFSLPHVSSLPDSLLPNASEIDDDRF